VIFTDTVAVAIYTAVCSAAPLVTAWFVARHAYKIGREDGHQEGWRAGFDRALEDERKSTKMYGQPLTPDEEQEAMEYFARLGDDLPGKGSVN
jgi:hypothetical protein